MLRRLFLYKEGGKDEPNKMGMLTAKGSDKEHFPFNIELQTVTVTNLRHLRILGQWY